MYNLGVQSTTLNSLYVCTQITYIYVPFCIPQYIYTYTYIYIERERLESWSNNTWRCSLCVCVNNLGSESRIKLQLRDKCNTATIHCIGVHVMHSKLMKIFSLGIFNYFIFELKWLWGLFFWWGASLLLLLFVVSPNIVAIQPRSMLRI